MKYLAPLIVIPLALVLWLVMQPYTLWVKWQARAMPRPASPPGSRPLS